MNSELKVIIFEQKKILQNLLKLLDEQYNLVLNKDVIALGKIAEDIEEEGKKLATIEIKRRNIASEEEFNNFIKNTDDEHITNVYYTYSPHYLPLQNLSSYLIYLHSFMDLFLSLIIGLSLIMFSFYKKFMKIIIYFKVKGDILYCGTFMI